jgi:predicted transcriptional regulator
MAEVETKAKLIELTAGIVAAYVEHNKLGVADLPALIKATHDALGGVGQAEATAAADDHPKATAAQIRKSITPDALISFIDGKPYKTLKRHLTTHGMTVAEYKAAWGLPNDYPTTAPSYSEARSAMAKNLGLGKGGRGGGRTAAPAKPAAKATKGKK